MSLLLVQPDFCYEALVTALAVVHVLPDSQDGQLGRVKVELVRVGHHVVLVQVVPPHVQLPTQLSTVEDTGWFGWWVEGGGIRVMDNMVTV